MYFLGASISMKSFRLLPTLFFLLAVHTAAIAQTSPPATPQAPSVTAPRPAPPPPVIPREPYYPEDVAPKKPKPEKPAQASPKPNIKPAQKISPKFSTEKAPIEKAPIESEPVSDDTVPSLSSKNMISLPWDTFLSLWNQSRDPEIRRQLPYAYGKALYIGTAAIEESDYLITFNASFEITTFGESEKLIPFLSSELDIESVLLDNKPSTWAEKNGFLHVLISGEGDHVLTAKFTVKIPASHWPRSFDLPLVPIPQNEVVLHVPDTNVEGSFTPGVTLDPISGETESQLSAVVPATTHVAVAWSHKVEGQENLPAQLASEVYTLAEIDEQGATLTALVHTKILQGAVNRFKLAIPGGPEVLEVASKDVHNPVDQWYLEDGEQGKILTVTSRKIGK